MTSRPRRTTWTLVHPSDTSFSLTCSSVTGLLPSMNTGPPLRSGAAITKAAAGLQFPITETTNILNSSSAGAYPIATTTYVIIYTDQKDQAKAQTLVDFWHWGLTKGQASLTSLNYAPLPPSVAQGALQELTKIKANGTAITPSAGA